MGKLMLHPHSASKFARILAASALLALTGCSQIPLFFFGDTFRARANTTDPIPAVVTLSLENPNFNISEVTTPTIKVANAPDGRAVQLFRDSTCTTQVATGTVAGGEVNLTSSTLSAGAYVFAARYADETGAFGACSTSTVSYVVDTTPVTVSFSQLYQRVSEGSGLQNLAVTLSGSKPYDVVLNYNTKGTLASGTLINGFTSGTITIPAGQTTVNLPITIASDGLATGERRVQVNLTGKNSSSVKSGARMQTRISIRDTDTPVVSFAKVSAGFDNTCGITSTGSLQCWGRNNFSQLGDGTTTDRSTPVKIDSATTYSEISSGYENMCGITTTGELRCWGIGYFGINGDGTQNPRTTPAVTDGGTNYSMISVGYQNFVCGITTANVLKCWGDNTASQLGDGTTNQALSPIVIDGGTTYSSVDAGYQHACAITTTGELRCWGSNGLGQLGDTTTTDRSTPVVIDAGTNYSSVSASFEFTCGITVAGVLKCWGNGPSGELGIGIAYQVTTPTVVDAGTNYSKVVTGPSFACGLTTTGVAKCWGNSRDLAVGSTGDGDAEHPTTPDVVDSGTTYLDIATGSNQHTCGVTSAGLLKCWGGSSYGETGIGEITDQRTPITALDDATYSTLSMRGSTGCGITPRGTLRCWGTNEFGRLGDGTTNGRTVPVDIDTPTRYQMVDAGVLHTCGITTAGVLKCWGRNDWGQLGDGTQIDASTPTTIDAGTTYRLVTVGREHTCAITTAQVLKCWGYNLDGFIGDGSTTNRFTPVVIDTGVSYLTVASSDWFSCGITVAGQIKCWGQNYSGQLGDGTTNPSLAPVAIDVGTVYAKLSVGREHACAITAASVLRCWGLNFVGQLGDGTTTNRLSSVVSNVGVSYQSVSASNGGHTCGITSTGVLKCWGSNGNGQVGDGTMTAASSAIVIDAGTTYSSVSAAAKHTCGITASGAVKCWGSSANGRFGDGTLNNWPVQIVTGLN